MGCCAAGSMAIEAYGYAGVIVFLLVPIRVAWITDLHHRTTMIPGCRSTLSSPTRKTVTTRFTPLPAGCVPSADDAPAVYRREPDVTGPARLKRVVPCMTMIGAGALLVLRLYRHGRRFLRCGSDHI